MKKIFTLISGLLLMSAVTANADPIYVYVCDYDGNDIASPFETELTKDEDGNYVIKDFMYSEAPAKFKFEQPKVGEWGDITMTGNLDSSQEYPYLLDEEGYGLTCYLWGYKELEDWTPLYWPYIADGEYSSVYRYDMSNPDNTYEYYASICMNGYLNEEYTKKIGWIYVDFYFNEPSGAKVEGISSADNAPVEFFNISGQRVENPYNGIFIRKQGNKVNKIVIR